MKRKSAVNWDAVAGLAKRLGSVTPEGDRSIDAMLYRRLSLASRLRWYTLR